MRRQVFTQLCPGPLERTNTSAAGSQHVAPNRTLNLVQAPIACGVRTRPPHTDRIRRRITEADAHSFWSYGIVNSETWNTLIQEALRAFEPKRFVSDFWISLHRRFSRDCQLRSRKLSPISRHAFWHAQIGFARGTSYLRAFGETVIPHWEPLVCARRAERDGDKRHRRHHVADISASIGWCSGWRALALLRVEPHGEKDV